MTFTKLTVFQQRKDPYYMDIKVTEQPIDQIKTDFLIVTVFEDNKESKQFKLLDEKLNGKLTKLVESGEIKGMLVGDDHPMGNKTYLARLNGKRVLTADITKNSLNRKVYDLRDKTILEFKTSQINMIELIHGKEALTFKKNKASWQLAKKEMTAKGSKSEISNLLNTIRTARI